MSIGLKVSIGATVILMVSVVGVLAAERFDSANQDDAAQARGTGPDRDKQGDVKAVAKVLDLGTVAKISANYRVAVTEVSRYVVPGGQLIVATVDATYAGKKDGEPWADLTAEFSGSGSQTFDESGCPFDLGDADPADQPALGTGDKATYAVCIDLPDIDTKGGSVVVYEAFSTGDRIGWSTKDAVNKTLPSSAPASPTAQAPGIHSQPRRQPAHHDRSDDACDNFDEHKFEDYKDWGEHVQKQFKAYKDAGGDDEDKIDDYKDWKEEYDKRIDWLEKLDKAC
jgi:hypothetical protein